MSCIPRHFLLHTKSWKWLRRGSISENCVSIFSVKLSLVNLQPWGFPLPFSVLPHCSRVTPLLPSACVLQIEKTGAFSNVVAGMKSFLLLIVCILLSPRHMKLPTGMAIMNLLLVYLIVKEYRDLLSWVSGPSHVRHSSEGTPLYPHTVLI